MKLVVAEKPSVANTIATMLGIISKENGYIMCNDEYIVSWCIGHLVGLAMPESYSDKYAEKPWTFENLPIIPTDWKFTVNKSTREQFLNLKSLMNRADISEIICATDAGREGECIFRYVYNLVGSSKPVKRLWTSSLEESALRQGFMELKSDSEYDNLFAAGFARAKADWLVGLNATRIFSVRYSTPLSIGRVQTPTLAMIVARNHAVKSFVKQKFYTVDIDCGNFSAVTEKMDDISTASRIQKEVDGCSVTVRSIKRTPKKVNPPKLYDLTTLQRDANRIYGFTAQQTLDYTQALYEKKLCTYPRTDSQYITDDMYATAENMVDTVFKVFSVYEVFSENATSNIEPNISRCINNNKVSDHHALLPTAVIDGYDLQNLPDTEFKILRLIALRLICAVATPYLYDSIGIELISNTNPQYTFRALGKNVLDNGWKVFQVKNTEDSEKEIQQLPQLSEGEVIDNVKSKVAERYTSPPKQYTEDTLLSAMETAGNSAYELIAAEDNSDIEKKGLGTPATRAAIIETLVKREYITREKKKLIPTEKGIKLVSCVPDEIKSPMLTADWERKLQNIEKGLGSAEKFMNEITDFVYNIKLVYAKKDESSAFSRTSIGTCPKCGKRVLSYPKSYSCESGKVDKGGCGFVIWKKIAGKTISEPQAKKLLETGKTDTIKGFKSKAGKSFDAALKLSDSNSVEFIFPKRR